MFRPAADSTAAMISRRHLTHRRNERGQTAVEFALVAPFLIALLLGIVQGGVAFHHYIAVTDAARAAAREAITARLDGLSGSDLATAAANAAPDLDPKKLGVTFNPTDPSTAPGGSTVTVTVTYPYEIDILGVVFCHNCSVSESVAERME